MMDYHNLIEWLLSGDVAIQYQTKRDLVECSAQELTGLQSRISEKGWGKSFLEKRDPVTGRWGNGIYSPKWISTHYTLLDLKNIGIDPKNHTYKESSWILLENLWVNQGKIRKDRYQDFCVSAMVLSICCYTRLISDKIAEIVDYLLQHHYPDGGWNCNWDHGDKHSSIHTTLTVLEAFRDYLSNSYPYRRDEINEQINLGHEYLLKRKLFRSLSTDEIIDEKMLMLSYPSRWKYDILRCLDYFQSVGYPYDQRMDEALDIVIKKQRKSNKWPLQQKYAGLVHFDMEQTGSDSRWNTLRALKVLKKYRPEFLQDKSTK
jgi:hypothetical protein